MKDLPAEQQAEMGERIRRRRKAIGKTQTKLAEDLGIAARELAKIEVGAAPLSEGMASKVTQLLKVEKKWLLSGEGESPESPDDRRISGAQIRKLRESLAMSREELSAHIGLKPSTLHNVELGHQRLGPAATAALKQLASHNRENGYFKLDDPIVDLIIDKAIEETHRLVRDPGAMEALKSLTQSLGDAEASILKNLVKNKVKAVIRDEQAKAPADQA